MTPSWRRGTRRVATTHRDTTKGPLLMNALTRAGLIAGGIVAAGAVLVACASENENKTPDAVAADTLHDFDSGLPFTNTSQLDVAFESRRPSYDIDGLLRGHYTIQPLLLAADNHSNGTSDAFTGADQIRDGKATYNEIVQVVRGFDADKSNLLNGDEAKAFDRSYAPDFEPNPYYHPIDHSPDVIVNDDGDSTSWDDDGAGSTGTGTGWDSGDSGWDTGTDDGWGTTDDGW